jgi:hypothetical protein
VRARCRLPTIRSIQLLDIAETDSWEDNRDRVAARECRAVMPMSEMLGVILQARGAWLAQCGWRRSRGGSAAGQAGFATGREALGQKSNVGAREGGEEEETPGESRRRRQARTRTKKEQVEEEICTGALSKSSRTEQQRQGSNRKREVVGTGGKKSEYGARKRRLRAGKVSLLRAYVGGFVGTVL